MEPILPFWFKQRQAKAEPAGPDTYRLTAPNLREAFVSIRHDSEGRWGASLRLAADGPDVAVTTTSYATPGEAWDAAFELYRRELVV
ncbi:MAG TPA: hypothetical protein VKA46_12190 [Gemmataceae bacterium]|nr:hypothetical protein [Gemmataceae bacterium]